ncbi:hypothetical protein EBB07_24635 [Paenibacillaceae bacterium]|nr:hypothetical protein EBB07_24635 [Paenibacillaceae bacterium]
MGQCWDAGVRHWAGEEPKVAGSRGVGQKRGRGEGRRIAERDRSEGEEEVAGSPEWDRSAGEEEVAGSWSGAEARRRRSLNRGVGQKRGRGGGRRIAEWDRSEGEEEVAGSRSGTERSCRARYARRCSGAFCHGAARSNSI